MVDLAALTIELASNFRSATERAGLGLADPGVQIITKPLALKALYAWAREMIDGGAQPPIGAPFALPRPAPLLREVRAAATLRRFWRLEIRRSAARG